MLDGRIYGYEEVTVRDLIYGTMRLPAAKQPYLALVTSGSGSNFVALMNEKACSIGMYTAIS